MTDYKQLAEDLYETIKEVKKYLPSHRLFSNVDKVLHKYEQETTRGTGRTTALYMKAITEALENPDKSVEFIDHYPHHWGVSAKMHRDSLELIIKKLGYDISVDVIGTQVFLCNRFGR